MLTTGCVSRSPHSTTIRFDTIAARRSSSSSTTFFSLSMASAISTMPTAPSTRVLRAATTACACWRRSIAPAISVRIGEVGEAAFVDGDAGDREAGDQLVAKLGADLVMIAAKRDFEMFEIVIGIARADGADRGFDLDPDELLVIVDVEQRLGGVDHAPHDLRRHLDRVAAQVVDLDLVGNEVVGADRQFLAHHPRQHPAQPGRAVGALIVAEQGDRRGLVGLQHVEAAGDEQISTIGATMTAAIVERADALSLASSDDAPDLQRRWPAAAASSIR